MSAANNKDKLTGGINKKVANKSVAMGAGKTLPAVDNAHNGRRPDYMNGGEIKYIMPKVFITSRLRPIGNSKGVILINQLIKASGINAEADIVIQANDGAITIKQVKAPGINTDLSTWDKQFKAVTRKGEKFEHDLHEGVANDLTQKNSNVNQFEVFTVAPDGTKGAAMNKQSPVVIISPNPMNKNLNIVLIAPLTYSVKGFPSRVNSRFSGQPGEIALDQIRGVHKSRLKKKLGTIDANTAANIKSVVAAMFS
jgi:mRNA interferase MazF